MLTQPCLACQSPAVRWLESLSEDAYVNYFRCEKCGHVWAMPKGQTDAVPTVITNAKSA